MSDEKKLRDIVNENRALRACLEALMRRDGTHVFRVEATVDPEHGAQLTVSAPALPREREREFGLALCEAFCSMLALDGARQARSIGRDDEGDEVKP